MLTGAAKEPAERFSFVLAVVLTPPVVALELVRLLRAVRSPVFSGPPIDLDSSLLFGALGALASFAWGLLALRWLSRWLESGRWYLFGIYCLIASALVFYLHARGMVSLQPGYRSPLSAPLRCWSEP